MRKFITLFILSLCVFGLIINDAEARRFGGGRSFGMQRSASSYSRAATATSAASPNRWMGPLAGLAAGGLLASLFMGHGLGTGLLTWLMIGFGGLMLWNLFRNKLQPQTQQAQYTGYKQTAQTPFSQFTGLSSAPAATGIANFDTEKFLREAKVDFIRMQAAYDNKNSADIREFTSPEVFAEIQLQFQERDSKENVTEVITLNAELLDASTEQQSTLASVRFTGMLREDHDPDMTSLNETWHFRKDNSKWIVVGIQQN
ncbi:MAG: Tim44-like domain-containing protein [Gammaproteobacteria bacterium]|nr:Tim44-like domain-containing protein [Gammaproteobacteria bacterium]